MQYALLNGERIHAIKGKSAICIGCGQKVFAKCGSIKIHHWAHAFLANCDSWWESETIWHREWKEKFPEHFREVNFYDDQLCQFHRADIHTQAGVTIELQNSPIPFNELQSREQFYSKLIWVVNGLKFKGFKILKSIPNPNDVLLNEFEFCNTEHLSMIRKMDALSEKINPEILNFYHQELKHISFSTEFYSFSWRNAHQVWLKASCPIFIDFGGHFLYRIRKRHQISANYNYLQLVSKKLFIDKYC
ncbi:competence protein [Pedobacter chinensis]|uniref:Competence protein n=1 Tax=Pedobacter chinensis TaxID=2282421 RepID=A0A369Q371_9SPHI|nr:competence protein CoiA family protein [Pedobacter chinensis]RDC57905.1 competence protein [Pedobacter chinensis]